MEQLLDLNIPEQDEKDCPTMSSPSHNPSDPSNVDPTESSSNSQGKPQGSRRASRFLRDGAIGAYIYGQGRQSGSRETEAELGRQFEELDRRFLADLDRERDEQKHTIDKLKANHRTEIAARNKLEKQQMDGARMATRKLQVIGEQEREQMNERLKALASMHEEEIKQMKVEHGHKVDHLYKKIDKLLAEKTQGIDDWNGVHRGYEAEIERLRDSNRDLEKKLNNLTAGKAQEMIDWLCVHLQLEHPLKALCYDFEAVLEAQQRDPNKKKQTEAQMNAERDHYKEIRTCAEKLVVEKDQVILGLKSVCQETEGKIREIQGYNKELERKLRKAEEELRSGMGPKTTYKGLSTSQNEQNSTEGRPLPHDTPTQAHGSQPVIDRPSELQQLRAKNAEQRQMITDLQWSLANLGRQIPFPSHQPWIRDLQEPVSPPPSDSQPSPHLRHPSPHPSTNSINPQQ